MLFLFLLFPPLQPLIFFLICFSLCWKFLYRKLCSEGMHSRLRWSSSQLWGSLGHFAKLMCQYLPAEALTNMFAICIKFELFLFPLAAMESRSKRERGHSAHTLALILREALANLWRGKRHLHHNRDTVGWRGHSPFHYSSILAAWLRWSKGTVEGGEKQVCTSSSLTLKLSLFQWLAASVKLKTSTDEVNFPIWNDTQQSDISMEMSQETSSVCVLTTDTYSHLLFYRKAASYPIIEKWSLFTYPLQLWFVSDMCLWVLYFLILSYSVGGHKFSGHATDIQLDLSLGYSKIQMFVWLFFFSNPFLCSFCSMLWFAVLLKHIFSLNWTYIFTLTDWNRVSSPVCLYLAPSMLHVMTTSFPFPASEKQT